MNLRVERKSIALIVVVAGIALFAFYQLYSLSIKTKYIEISDENIRAFIKKTRLPLIEVKTDAISNGFIKKEFTCYGNASVPKISWSRYDDAPCYAVIVFDPDTRGGTFFHLFELVDAHGNVVKVYYNSALKKGWFPVCPPKGEVHRYYFLVIALDTCELETNNLTEFLTNHSLALGYVIGKFGVK
ncbi:hypothetical protein EYM_06890 [Ignicoccus islandicus DSM 13165]|uniref:PEBP family protein n=1 Tax=Ignicoccus islandicus DSM 13165 TaxID=940295 RepID=A0A0U3EBM8_9CREN|nr:hypothetical protein [Ignicoccus islandicus]ALU12734.1 hypothetical protein EYM_06890 [Ignicoccus islandicus DSM 13165]